MAETKPARPEVEFLGEVGRYHVRRIKRSKDQVVLDIREHLESSSSGYTRRGIALAIPGDVEKLRNVLDSIR